MSLLLLFQGTPAATGDLTDAQVLTSTIISTGPALNGIVSNTGSGVESELTTYHAVNSVFTGDITAS